MMRHRGPRAAAILIAGLVLFTVLGFWVLPAIARTQLETRLSKLLLRPTTVRAVKFDPYDLRLQIEGLEVADHDAPRLLAFDVLVVDVEATALLRGRIAFEEIRLSRPFIRVALEPRGRLNISDVLDALAARPQPPPDDEPSALPQVRVARLEITEGAVDFLDRSLAEPFATQLAPLEILLTDFTTEPDRNSPYAFQVRFDREARLSWTGDFSVNPLRSSGRVELVGLRLDSLAPYLKDVTQLAVRQGTLGVRADYRFDGTKMTGRITEGVVSLDALAVTPPGQDGAVVSIAHAKVDHVEVDLGAHTVRTGSITIAEPEVTLVRDSAGQIDLARMAAPPARASTHAATATAPASPWSVVIGGLGLRAGTLRLTDHGTPKPLALVLDELTIDTGALAIPPTGALTVTVGLRVNGKGRVKVDGTVPLGPGPLALDLSIDELDLAIAQPFVEPHARVELARGTASAQGRFTLEGGRSHYAGSVAVRGLSVMESQADREVLGLEELSLSGLDLALPPVVAGVETLRLAGLRTRMVVGPDGKSNYDGLATKATAPAPPPAPEAEPAASTINIAAVVLEDLRAEYTDRTLSPPFAVKLSGLSGRITPVRWPADRGARLDLAGRVDAAPLTIQGIIRPAMKRATMDLAIKLRGLDLLLASTYSAKYAGYPVSKGKLSLDLAYSLAERKLVGKNLIVVDQLTLGEKVESPDATWLPVKLGLAILTDKDGRMELDLPVGEDLDEPDFSVGKIILRALTNVLEKVATSPFALLGAVVGGEDRAPADRVPFAAGEATLTAETAAALEKVADAIAERPALRLSVSGTYERVSDGRALARERVASQLRDALKRAGRPPIVSEAAWAAHVRTTYGTRTSTAPLTFAQMEAAVLSSEAPSVTDLAALADARARAVQARLVEKLGPERVFVTVAEAPTGEDRAAILKVE